MTNSEKIIDFVQIYVYSLGYAYRKVDYVDPDYATI